MHPPPWHRASPTVAAFADVLMRHYDGLEPSAPAGWGPPLRVLDAALSVDLGADAVRIERARYRREVAMPVEAFRQRHPEVRTVADLRDWLAASPDEAADVLGDARRPAVARALAAFALDRLDLSAVAESGMTEAERLAETMGMGWTHVSDDDDVASGHVEAHGLAYLRMRLGAAVVVPEPAVLALADEVAGEDGDEQTVADAIRRTGLPPLAVLQAVRADWARGRAWSLDPPGPSRPEAWPPYLGLLTGVLNGTPTWEAVVGLHRTAPHRPPGLGAAERGDALATVRALGRHGRPPSFAAVADAVLVATYLDASGEAFDAEVWAETAHEATLCLARALRQTGEPVAVDLLAGLRRVFDQTARRTTRHWYRQAWDL